MVPGPQPIKAHFVHMTSLCKVGKKVQMFWFRPPPLQKAGYGPGYVTKWVTIISAHTGQSPVQTVPARPIQIRAHHYIDVCTDISNSTECRLSLS